jgi:NADPH-dependent 2,4-dienoyl-CoA reductase/sulfur reductase-like enzyme
MADTFALHQALTAGARSAIIVGGGSIGLEMAEAFTARGLTVTLMEQASAVMLSLHKHRGGSWVLAHARWCRGVPDRAQLHPHRPQAGPEPA